MVEAPGAVRLTRRAAAAFEAWRRASTTGDRYRVAQYCELSPNEIAALQRLEGNLAALGEMDGWFVRGDLREGTLDRLFAGLDVAGVTPETLVRMLAVKHPGRRYELERVLGMRSKPVGPTLADALVPWRGTMPERKGSRPLKDRLLEEMERRGLRLEESVPVPVREEMAAALGTTPGTISPLLTRMRKARGIALTRWPEKQGMANGAVLEADAVEEPVVLVDRDGRYLGLDVAEPEPPNGIEPAPNALEDAAWALVRAVIRTGLKCYPEGVAGVVWATIGGEGE